MFSELYVIFYPYMGSTCSEWGLTVYVQLNVYLFFILMYSKGQNRCSYHECAYASIPTV